MSGLDTRRRSKDLEPGSRRVFEARSRNSRCRLLGSNCLDFQLQGRRHEWAGR